MDGLTRLYRYSPGRLLGAIGADRILDSAGVRIRLGKNICPKMQVVAHSGASKKRPQLREKSRGQLQHTETRIGSKRPKRCPWRACSYSTPRVASPQQRLLAGAVYSHIF